MRTWDNPNLLNELLLRDFIRKLEPLFQLGWHIKPDTGKMAIRPGFSGIQHDVNWIHAKQSPDRPCRFYQLIHENCNFIPKRCLRCWKVVVRPNSLLQLLKLHDLQHEMVEKNPDCPCKCGWEERPWVHGNYGGYFYCDTQSLGAERFIEVKERVEEDIGKNIDVYLKRYCTEFELKWGDSARYARTPESRIMETAILEGSEIAQLNNEQPQYLKDHIMSDWILQAYKVGDPTARLYNNGEPLYTQPRRYYKTKKLNQTVREVKDGYKTESST